MAEQTAKQKIAAKRRAKLRSRDIRMTVVKVMIVGGTIDARIRRDNFTGVPS